METLVTGDPVRTIAVNIGAGELILSDSGGTHVEGVIESSEPPEIQQDGSWLRVRTDPRDEVRVRLSVPSHCTIAIRTRSADVSSSGGLEAATIGTGSGRVNLAEVGHLRVSSGSGHLTIGRVTHSLQAGTGSGAIGVTEAAHASVRSGSGAIRLGHVTGPTQIRSGSGDATVTSNAGQLRVVSASGSIRVGIPEGQSTWLDLRSRTGDVTVNLPAAPKPGDTSSASVEAETASGHIWIAQA